MSPGRMEEAIFPQNPKQRNMKGRYSGGDKWSTCLVGGGS